MNVSLPSKKKPIKFILQWHITERCNNRCQHCYQTFDDQKELSYEQLLYIIEEFKAFLYWYKKEYNIPEVHGHINVTGGEPFIRKDFFDLLKVFKDNSEYFSFAILSNGSLISEDNAVYLKTLSPSFIQISVDGNKKIHDSIRGKGNYKKTMIAIDRLIRNKLTTYLSFTANRMNYKYFPNVVKLGKKLKVTRIWVDRFIPLGNAEEKDKLSLSPSENKTLVNLIFREKEGNKSETEISMFRSLQFLLTGGKPYSCSAGKTLLSILSNGDVVPCRRMPVVIGNVLNNSLSNLYKCNDFLITLRDKHSIKGCEKCFYVKFCHGGLKCLSMQLNNDPFVKDPGCWL